LPVRAIAPSGIALSPSRVPQKRKARRTQTLATPPSLFSTCRIVARLRLSFNEDFLNL
jgi:hypothetical protein